MEVLKYQFKISYQEFNLGEIDTFLVKLQHINIDIKNIESIVIYLKVKLIEYDQNIMLKIFKE